MANIIVQPKVLNKDGVTYDNLVMQQAVDATNSTNATNSTMAQYASSDTSKGTIETRLSETIKFKKYNINLSENGDGTNAILLSIPKSTFTFKNDTHYRIFGRFHYEGTEGYAETIIYDIYTKHLSTSSTTGTAGVIVQVKNTSGTRQMATCVMEVGFSSTNTEIQIADINGANMNTSNKFWVDYIYEITY